MTTGLTGSYNFTVPIPTRQRCPRSCNSARAVIPGVKIRFVNVVDLFRLMPEEEHPHGLSEREFDSLFTTDKPVIFNFHAYAALIHKFTYRRKNHANFHVRGYKEKGNINTPLELAILNQVGRRRDRSRAKGRLSTAHTKQWLQDQIVECVNYAAGN